MGNFLNNLRCRMARFMYGRYGLDQLGRFLSGALLVCLVASLIFGGSRGGKVLYYAAIGLLVWSYFRMFSKNTSRRYQENVRFLELKRKVAGPLSREWAHMKQRKTHVFFKCPSCGQKMRTPRGQGEKHVTCPKCHTQFIKRT